MTGQGLHLTILGSGHEQYERLLREQVREYGAKDRVSCVPRVPADEIPSLLREHDVFLFTSTWAEPMARTVMEAMAAGMLVIGSEVGGQMEMLSPGQNALTFPPGSAAALADQIGLAEKDPEMRLRLAEAGRRLAISRFSLDRMVADFEAWLEQRSQEAGG